MLLMDDLQNNMVPFTPTKLAPPPIPLMNFKHYTMTMVHPTTGKTISSYKQLMNDPVTANTWQTAFGKDFESMCQGDNKTEAKGTNAMFVMIPEEVDYTPAARLATYANIVVNYQPQKDNPYQIRITADGNLINYPGELVTCTADIMKSKLHWNSVLSTQQAKYMFLDLKYFYHSAPLNQYKCMRIPISLFPAWIVAQYDLLHKVVKGHIYLEMQRAVWGLPQAGILANNLLHKRLMPHRFYECKQMPGLWKHAAQHISFTLVVDNVGMKYINKYDVNHLIKCLKEKYKLTKD
jgi:hypothetical protein